MNEEERLLLYDFCQWLSAHRARCVTWILCWKHSPLLRRTLDKSVALVIAKLLRPDLGGELMGWKFSLSAISFYTEKIWKWKFRDDHFFYLHPCPTCLFPTEPILYENRLFDKCVRHGKLEKGTPPITSQILKEEFGEAFILPLLNYTK